MRLSAGFDLLPAILRHLDFLFEERPLLPNEDAGQYDTLLRTIIAQVKPADVIEAIWVKDIVDLIWEAKRFRRWRGQILTQTRLQAVTSLILPVLEAQNHSPFEPEAERRREAETLAMGWLNGSADETSATEKLLRTRGLTPMDVTAHTFQLKLPDIERIERMITAADQRRDTLLREIERKRMSLSQQLRAASAEVIDVEPTVQERRMATPPRD
ncbi:hypothetical protein FV222_08560 [Methylobacterium sp. WL103]|uniref:hypothetical protein n=1 Tax=Methylobacterium sp. WL103 TaxID=2603891 RepID=UPI0011C74EE0|nr:hypothetical protein [Methylobacterium sp. WL103]TXN03428.1 hypothetical protein FV222_08560 [Methylobacterium sp. WL103]